jgi:hypothetical protein
VTSVLGDECDADLFSHVHVGDECDAVLERALFGDEFDSLFSLLRQSCIQAFVLSPDLFSLLRQSCIQAWILRVCVEIYIYICCLFAFLSIRDNCLPNSLFLLDTVPFICTTTSCRTCQPTFLPGFHRLSEFACFSWLFTEYCACVKVLNVCECVYV